MITSSEKETPTDRNRRRNDFGNTDFWQQVIQGRFGVGRSSGEF